MGNYDSQYESYYSKLIGRRPHSSYNGNFSYRNNNKSNKSAFDRSFFARRFMNELIGVLCLIIVVIMCKMFVTPETQLIYDYSKKMVYQNFDYSTVFDKVKNIKYADVQTYVGKLMDIAQLNK